MKAKEKLTYDQVMAMIEKRIQKAITDRNAEEFIVKQAIRLGMIEAMLDILIVKDPVGVAYELYLAERRFVLTRFSGSDDIKGEVVKEALTESLIMQYKQNMEQLEPHNIFTLSTKITEL